VYSGGGNGNYVASHEGFALRMPPAEVPDWQMTNDKGELVDIPRPALNLRVWSPEDGAYNTIDPVLTGAPRTIEEAEAWFVSVVRKLKGSNYIGAEILDRLACSERTVSTEPEFETAGGFSNKWTDLVVATSL